MKKLSLIILINLCMGLFSSLHAQLSPAFTARLQFVLDSVCNKYNIKGASTALLVPGAGVWKGTHGEASAGTPITSDMIFGIASDTKTYVSALMLKLQEMNMVHLTDTIGTWIHHENVNGQVTIKQLLNHTSGIREFEESDTYGDSVQSDFNRIWEPERVLDFVGAPYWAPGGGSHYSNTNYVIAGLIIKQVMNQPFSTTLNNLILAPHGLNHTILFPEQTSADPMPDVWSIRNSTGTLINLMTYGYSHNANFSIGYTCGGIMTTAEDNAQFWHKLISGQIINASSLSQMMSWMDIGSGMDYGLGMFRYRNGMNGHKPLYAHGGTDIGFIFENLVDSMSGVCISILTNQDSIRNSVVHDRLLAALHKVSVKMPAVTGVNDFRFDNTSVQFYPNPAKDMIQLTINEMDNVMQLHICDLTGKQIFLKEIREQHTSVSVKELEEGLYISYITNANGQIVYTHKIQIIK